ncbi:MAG: CAP domain-containing protein [Patescibacteria group bacterium]|nr:CAP domain-containing protein [Patescibacteria group bacterium]
MGNIKTYLCHKYRSVTEIDKNILSGDGISVSDNNVEMKIQPFGGCGLVDGNIRTRIVSDSGNTNMVECLSPYIGSGGLSWKRNAYNYGIGDSFSRRDKYIEVSFTNPDDICHWIQTGIYRKRVNVPYNFYLKNPTFTGGEIPISQTKSDYYSLTFNDEYTPLQVLILPGESLNLFWRLKYGNTYHTGYVSGCWFHTPAITGGTIESSAGEGADVQYTVDSQAVTQLCVPSDFAQYQTDSWVYLLKVNNTAASETERSSDYGDGRDDDTADRSTEVDEDVSENTFARLINIERAKEGIDPVTISAKLHIAAERHAKDMAENEFMAHIGTDGSTATERIIDAGYLDDPPSESWSHFEGENVGAYAKSATQLMGGWMSSPGHRANILNPDYHEISIAVDENNDGQKFFALEFGGRSDKNDGEEVPPAGADSLNYMLVPITVNSPPTVVDDFLFETIDYNMKSGDNFSKFFEMSCHYGTIKSVDHLFDKANVEIEIDNNTETYNDVEIFYHCHESEEVAGGGAAFSPDDEVVVLNDYGKTAPSASDLTIIGFKNGLKHCKFQFKIYRDSENGSGEEFGTLIDDAYSPTFTITGSDGHVCNNYATYDTETEYWIITFYVTPEVSEFWVEWEVEKSIPTQYAVDETVDYIYKTSEKEELDDLITIGKYIVNAPYWDEALIEEIPLNHYTPLLWIDTDGTEKEFTVIRKIGYDVWQAPPLCDPPNQYYLYCTESDRLFFASNYMIFMHCNDYYQVQDGKYNGWGGFSTLNSCRVYKFIKTSVSFNATVTFNTPFNIAGGTDEFGHSCEDDTSITFYVNGEEAFSMRMKHYIPAPWQPWAELWQQEPGGPEYNCKIGYTPTCSVLDFPIVQKQVWVTPAPSAISEYQGIIEIEAVVTSSTREYEVVRSMISCDWFSFDFDFE